MEFYEEIKERTKTGLEKIDEVFNPLINAVEMKITRLTEAKQDPTNYFDVDENEHFNFVEILGEYKVAKQETVDEFLAKIQESISAYEASGQTLPATKEEAFYQILYLIVINALQKGVRIKIGNVTWDSTKPLGGEGSVFVEVRNKALEAIGIDPKSDLGKIITDPFNAVSDLTGNTKKELETAINNVKKETEVAISNISKETVNAINNAKREADKVATNIVREVTKVKPKIKIKIKKPRITW